MKLNCCCPAPAAVPRQGALALARGPPHQQPAALHLRLLHLLANDVCGCDGLRAEVAARQEAQAELHVQKHHSDAEVGGWVAGCHEHGLGWQWVGSGKQKQPPPRWLGGRV